MDEQKAIEWQQTFKHTYNGVPEEVNDACDAAIAALQEIQKYRALGSVEYLEELKERDTAKRPDYEGDGYADGYMVYDTWICPNCGVKYEVDYDKYDFCPDCGQRIDWDD